MTGDKLTKREDDLTTTEDLTASKRLRTTDDVAGNNDSTWQLSLEMLTGCVRIGTLDLSPEEEDEQKCVEELKKMHSKIVELENKFLVERDEWEAKYWEASRDEHDENNFSVEKAAWEEKYQEQYEPLYKRRYEIVNGISNVTKDKGVPGFWLQAMMANKLLADAITTRDEEALKYLTDIKCRKIDNPKGFELDFVFDPKNTYFKNPVLTKTYHAIGDNQVETTTIGTEIKWCTPLNYESCLTRNSVNKRQVLKTTESFFNLFNNTPHDHVGEPQPEGVIPQDYAIGLTIRDKITPHAISWYNGDEKDDYNDGGEDDDEFGIEFYKEKHYDDDPDVHEFDIEYYKSKHYEHI